MCILASLGRRDGRVKRALKTVKRKTNLKDIRVVKKTGKRDKRTERKRLKKGEK